MQGLADGGVQPRVGDSDRLGMRRDFGPEQGQRCENRKDGSQVHIRLKLERSTCSLDWLGLMTHFWPNVTTSFVPLLSPSSRIGCPDWRVGSALGNCIEPWRQSATRHWRIG